MEVYSTDCFKYSHNYKLISIENVLWFSPLLSSDLCLPRAGLSDIILTPEQQATLEALANENDPSSPQLAVVRSERSLWSEGRVPYVLDSSLSSSAVQAIQQAISDYSRQTCIRFVPRRSEADYVRFYRGSG